MWTPQADRALSSVAPAVTADRLMVLRNPYALAQTYPKLVQTPRPPTIMIFLHDLCPIQLNFAFAISLRLLLPRQYLAHPSICRRMAARTHFHPSHARGLVSSTAFYSAPSAFGSNLTNRIFVFLLFFFLCSNSSPCSSPLLLLQPCLYFCSYVPFMNAHMFPDPPCLGLPDYQRQSSFCLVTGLTPRSCLRESTGFLVVLDLRYST